MKSPSANLAVKQFDGEWNQADDEGATPVGLVRQHLGELVFGGEAARVEVDDALGCEVDECPERGCVLASVPVDPHPEIEPGGRGSVEMALRAMARPDMA